VGIWAEHVLPRAIDVALGRENISQWRRRCVEGLAGVVVEPGFGSGLNIPHYPSGVTHVYAVDPSELGHRLASKRIAASPVTIEPVGDAGLLTYTLCTIPDHLAALAELLRVIRPGGRLHFLEHGRAPDASVARWQDRLTPIQRRLADGCHLNRAIVDDIASAGFIVESHDSSYEGPPKPLTWFTVGVARVPD